MTLEDIRAECSAEATLLQPYVDGELGDAETEQVARHLESCRGCRCAVQEQQWVRATVRTLPPVTAPAKLRTRILATMDQIDAEGPSPTHGVTGAERRTGTQDIADRPSTAKVRDRWVLWAPVAFAAAAALVVLVGSSTHPVEINGHQLGAAMTSTAATAESARAPEIPLAATFDDISQARLELIAAQIADPERRRTSLRYRLLRGGRPTGLHVVDQQGPAGGLPQRGLPVVFGGQQYLIDHTSAGSPVLHFEAGGTAHMLMLEGEHPEQNPSVAGDFSVLLHLANDDLRRPTPSPR